MTEDIKMTRVGLKGGPWYEPQENITAYELAQIVDLFMRAQMGAPGIYDFWLSLPDNVKRHFTNEG